MLCQRRIGAHADDASVRGLNSCMQSLFFLGHAAATQSLDRHIENSMRSTNSRVYREVLRMVPREQSIRVICRYIMIEFHEALCLFLPTRQLFPFDIRPLSGAARVSVTLFGPAVSIAHCDLSKVHSEKLATGLWYTVGQTRRCLLCGEFRLAHTNRFMVAKIFFVLFGDPVCTLL